ncbi:MAG: UDP-3-O-acyl-N-acetylglucosamine deacetylase [Pirellulales bacterium]|nr:UDP-3-O-acyl-N-acetylglucosamine deacetylase [Pirellulales bacterium]
MNQHLRSQRTLSDSTRVEGFGFWSSRDVAVEFRPAPVNTGIVFVRGDLQPARRIPATIAHRIETPRRTTLTARGASVEMVEHIMAALSGLRIDNCEVWVDAPEMPGCDGSSLAFVQALDSVGVVEQDALRPVLAVREPMRIGNEDAWIEARPAADRGCHIRFRVDYGLSSPIGRQIYRATLTPETFRAEIAGSRTFLLQPEAEWLRSQGLAKRTTYQNALVFDDEGPLENELRFPEECARHKLLDVVGDLALTGCDIVGEFTAYRSGHRLNADMAKALLTEAELRGGWRRSA